MKDRGNIDIAEIVIRSLIVIAVAAATVMCAVIFTIANNKTVKREISRRATEKMISEAAAQLGEEYMEDGEDGVTDEVSGLLEEMTESDRNRIADIVQNHMDAETLSEMAKALSKGDEEKLEAFAKENLTRTEQRDLMKIAEKYGLIE